MNTGAALTWEYGEKIRKYGGNIRFTEEGIQDFITMKKYGNAKEIIVLRKYENIRFPEIRFFSGNTKIRFFREIRKYDFFGKYENTKFL